ncbi:MAG: YceI family protein [Flavobacteriaceae bacterium]|nr:MAG: YceI family protein [Flavobacteriaceae bacterium]
MKKTIIVIACFIALGVHAQKYYTKTGTTELKASVAAFEPVEATNKSTSVVLKADTGDIAALLFIKAFRFKVALMEEHFNENYMDSDAFPKATFKGKIQEFDLEFTGQKEFKIIGTLTVRGINKEIETTGTFSKNDEKLSLNATFSVKPQDFDIKIPNIVRKKIAETIHLTLNYELIQKK